MRGRRYLLAIAGAAAAGALLIACESRIATEFAAVGTPVARDTAPLDDGNRAADALRNAALMSALKSDPLTRDADIQVSVEGGRVRLSGFVDNAATRLRAGALAAQIDGVAAVENRLILRHRADIAPDPIGDARVYL